MTTQPLFSDQPVPAGKRPIAARTKEAEKPAFREPPQPEPEPEPEPPTLSAVSVQEELKRRIEAVDKLSDEQLLKYAGLDPVFSTTEAAQFFDRSNQWLYWGLRQGVFTHRDSGEPIDPERIGDGEAGRRRFTLPILKDILYSSYKRGNITDEELKRILRRIKVAELGGDWREREGWHFISGKWTHPSRCEKVNGKWVKKKSKNGIEDDEDE